MTLPNIRLALRVLRRSPGFSVVAVLVMALGIGATSAIFSIVNGVLLRPLPFRDPDGIVHLGGRMMRDSAEAEWPLSPLDIDGVRPLATAFASVAMVSNIRSFNVAADRELEHVQGELVSAEFFDVYGVRPAAGRVFTDEEARAPGAQVVVISQDFFQRRFGGDASRLNTSITLNDQLFTVIGVMPRGFHGTSDEAAIWAPIGLAARMYNQPAYLEMRQFRWGQGIARLKEGVSVAAAQQMSDVHARAMAERYPENQGLRMQLTPLSEQVRGGLRGPLLALMAASAFVLLIACTNLANLLLARGAGRSRELAVRRAIGAGSRELMGMLVTETMVLGAIGGGLGLLLAVWIVRVLLRFGALDVAGFLDVGVDARVLGATALISVLSAAAFGLVPAMLSTNEHPADVLRTGSRGTGDQGRRRFQDALIAAEVALALVLLVGAGLTAKGFGRFMAKDLGYRADGLLTMRMDFSAERYRPNETMAAALAGIVARARTTPGVEAVAIEGPSYPGFGPYLINLDRSDREPGPGTSQARRHNVTPGYFATMGIPLQAGRDFTDADVASSQKVAIVSRALARRLWEGEDAVGKTFYPNGNRELAITVIGVAGEVMHGGPDGEENLFADLYVPAMQFPPRNPALAALIVRGRGDPNALVAPLTAAIQAEAPGVAPFSVATIRAHLDEQNADGLFLVFLMKAFAVLALVLAAVGIYGVIAYTVGQRTREIGIRIALGAQRESVLALVLRRALAPVAVGVVLGGIAAASLTGLARSLLYGLNPHDPATFTLMAGVLAIAAVLAMLIPATRATRIDPIVAFRQEG